MNDAQLRDWLSAYEARALDGCRRIARRFELAFDPARHDTIFAVWRQHGPTGAFRDADGPLAYRFHGSGCEIDADGVIVDFNSYPLREGRAAIYITAWALARWLASNGVHVDPHALEAPLARAAERGWLHRLEPERPYYHFPLRAPDPAPTPDPHR